MVGSLRVLTAVAAGLVAAPAAAAPALFGWFDYRGGDASDRGSS